MKQVKLLVFLALVGAASVHAETVYIGDNLRVGVRPAPDSTLTPIAVVQTGMRLELLEKRGAYLHIRTPEGVTGWIKDIYTSRSAPAILRLKALQRKQAALQQQLQELKQDNHVLATANQSLQGKVGELNAIRDQLQLEAARRQVLEDKQAVVSSWYWWGLLVLLVGGAGFFSGLSWYRHAVMRRLGGLRV